MAAKASPYKQCSCSDLCGPITWLSLLCFFVDIVYMACRVLAICLIDMSIRWPSPRPCLFGDREVIAWEAIALRQLHLQRKAIIVGYFSLVGSSPMLNDVMLYSFLLQSAIFHFSISVSKALLLRSSFWHNSLFDSSSPSPLPFVWSG